MSITFCIPAAGAHLAPCPLCAQAAVEGWGERREGGRIACDRLCTGEVMVANGPELNVSNRNAQLLLDCLGLALSDDGDFYGEIPVELLPEIIRRTIRVLNSDTPLPTIAPRSEVGARGCQVYDYGQPDGYIADRVESIQAILVFAAQRGLPVSFS